MQQQKKWCVENFQGQTFNQLTVVGPSESQSERSIKRDWLDVMCRCACGTVKPRPLQKVVKGELKSCGCLGIKGGTDTPRIPRERKVQAAQEVTASAEAVHRKLLRAKFDDYVKKSKQRGFEVLKPFSVWRDLVTSPCWYTGRPPEVRHSVNGTFRCHGLDRLDNDKGYDVNNVVPCCSDVNMIRGSLPQHTFLYLCAALSDDVDLPEEALQVVKDLAKVVLSQRAVRSTGATNVKIPWEDVLSTCREVHAYRKSKAVPDLPEIFAESGPEEK